MVGGGASSASALDFLRPGGGLLWPVECPADVCWVQNYVDHDPGPGVRDWAGGRLSYDGHGGTDIRVADPGVLGRGVPVVAAAPGIVVAVRDGEPDRRPEALPAVRGPAEAGNAVLVDHGGGWRSFYGHLRRGSVAVVPGMRVAAGQRLGLVGQSGAADFPHLDFSLLHHGRPVDPFRPAGLSASHDAAAGRPLWSSATPAAVLDYRPARLAGAGFAPGFASAAAVRADGAAAPVTRGAPGVALWIDLAGLRAGDREAITLVGPGGVLVERVEQVGADAATRFRVVGRRRPGDGPWPAGRYRARYELRRGGILLIAEERSLELR